jgi:hypothetical protein
MSGVIHPLPNTPSWRGAQLKHRDKFTLPLPSPMSIIKAENKINYVISQTDTSSVSL